MNTNALTFAQEVAAWPTLTELAEQSGFRRRTLARAVTTGELAYVRHNVVRVSPVAFADWLARRQDR